MDNRLVFSFSSSYIYPFLISIFSAKINSHESITADILVPENETFGMDLDEESKLFISRVLVSLKIKHTFSLIKINFTQNELPTFGKIPATAWLRVFAAFDEDYYPDGIMYYFDPDIIFHRGYDEIFKIKSDGDIGVSACIFPGHEDFERKYPARSSSVCAPWYFNAGVLVVNLRKIRANESFMDWMKYIINYDRYGFSKIDQDVLNAIVRGEQEILPVEFNSQPWKYEASSTKITHFAGGSKPWYFRKNRIFHYKLNRNQRKANRTWFQTEKELLEYLEIHLPDQDFKRVLFMKQDLQNSFFNSLSLIFPKLANSGLVSSCKNFWIENKFRRVGKLG